MSEPKWRRYDWPSWCNRHHRPHITYWQMCMTNRERRRLTCAIAEFRASRESDRSPRRWERPSK
jgi:hypothetical protein